MFQGHVGKLLDLWKTLQHHNIITHLICMQYSCQIMNTERERERNVKLNKTQVFLF